MIPLEDSFSDVLGKTQRGLKLTDDQLAAKAGVTVPDLTRVKGGEFDEAIVRKLAGPLGLGAATLVALGKKAWHPAPVTLEGLAQFNTAYEDMMVNSYLVWDPATKAAAAFDSGATAAPLLEAARQRGLSIQLILITHTHVDHVADLEHLRKATGAPAFVGKDENFAGAEPFAEGRTFQIGGLTVETRQTSGHARGGISFVITGLSRPVVVVGDALFASSMGGGMISFEEALRNNRAKLFTLPDNTVVCPGHGPLTTIGEEKANNPFYPEFQKA